MSNLFRPNYTRVDPETGKRVTRPLRKWYGKYRDADGVEKRVPLCEDKESAKAMLAELVRRVERMQAGIIEACDEHLKRPIEEHLADYRASLEAKARDEKHVRDTIRTVNRIVTDCRMKLLAELQQGGDPLEKYLAGRLREGKSHRTVNADLVAVRSFCRWLLSRQRMRQDPTVNLIRLNEAQDRRRERRALTNEEAQRLLDTTLHSTREFRGLCGEDRWILYLIAQRTGLRRKELLSLRQSSYDFSTTPATITVKARSSKRRKLDVLPLSDDVAQVVQNWLHSKPDAASLWPGGWWRRSAEMLQLDLEEAGIESVDSSGRVLDFHGQRTTFITSLARAGVTPAIAQRLARHSDINLTLGAYTKLQLNDLHEAVGKLPELNAEQKPALQPFVQKVTPTVSELETICNTWPHLSESIRLAIMALVRIADEPPK